MEAPPPSDNSDVLPTEERPPLVHRRRVRDFRPPAQAPGSLTHVGERHEQNVRFHVIDYDSDGARELHTDSLDECLRFEVIETPTWIRVIGLHDVEKLSGFLERHGVHPLLQDDILNTNQRPKIENVGGFVFAVIKLVIPSPNPERGSRIENLSILVSPQLVLSFHESDSDLFDPVVRRILEGGGRIRTSGSDYLLWAILDAVVDHYFIALNRVEDEIERLDASLMAGGHAFDPRELHSLKQDLFHLHRAIRPVRELVGGLSKIDGPVITPDTAIYFRDLYDHGIHAIEIIESLREAVNSLRDFHANAVNLRTNEIMKVLTAFATIFLPLTFLAGVYGMNFDHMPEYAWPWSYPLLWLVFLLSGGLMFRYFRKRRWL